jgi:hypothetical protein
VRASADVAREGLRKAVSAPVRHGCPWRSASYGRMLRRLAVCGSRTRRCPGVTASRGPVPLKVWGVVTGREDRVSHENRGATIVPEGE